MPSSYDLTWTYESPKVSKRKMRRPAEWRKCVKTTMNVSWYAHKGAMPL